MSFDDNSNDYSFNSDYSGNLDTGYSANRDDVSATPPTPPKRGWWESNFHLIIAACMILSVVAAMIAVIINLRDKKLKAETAKVTAVAFAREIVPSYEAGSSGEIGLATPRLVPPSLKKTAVVITNGDTKVHVLEILHTGKDRIAVEVVTNEGE